MEVNLSLGLSEIVFDDGTGHDENSAERLQHPVVIGSRLSTLGKHRQRVTIIHGEDSLGHAEQSQCAKQRVIAGELTPIVLEAVPNEVETDD